MKKEYLILAAVIALLSGYLVLHKENGNNYALPELSKIEISDITGIDIKQKEKSFLLKKDDNLWFLGDKKYPADSNKVDKMVDIVKELSVTALVSEQGSLKRYELDPENRIKVKVLSGSETIREFEIGKTAPTYNHTFIRIKGDKKVYHAKKSFRSDFDLTVGDLRDKKVFSFELESINEITIEKGELKKEFYLAENKLFDQDSDETVENEIGNLVDKDSDNGKFDNEKKEKIWKSKEGSEFDKKAFDSLVSMVSDFNCSQYSDSDSKELYLSLKPLCRIIVDDMVF
ncbi:MAG: DUF4340 domain-containing protein, partial [Thermodesulfobacteriota bacterium]|nr:DUF4340 domain-containing protein [Thermodesulfobacteriota bacterium]